MGLSHLFNGSWENDDWECREWHAWDEVVFALGDEELRAELGRVARQVEGAGLVFPWEDLEELVSVWYRMNQMQRIGFVDFIRLLGAWAEEQEKAGRRAAEERGVAWGEAERKFLFCLFIQILSGDRSMEAFISRTDKADLKARVIQVVTDVLGFFFYRNLSDLSVDLWGEVFGEKEGFRFMRRGGLGQFFRWGDGEWERRRSRAKASVKFYSTLGEKGWEMPWYFLELAGEWRKEDKWWGKSSSRVRRVDARAIQGFLKL